MFSPPEMRRLILQILISSSLQTFEPRLQKIALMADQSSGEKSPKMIGLTYSSCLGRSSQGGSSSNSRITFCKVCILYNGWLNYT